MAVSMSSSDQSEVGADDDVALSLAESFELLRKRHRETVSLLF